MTTERQGRISPAQVDTVLCDIATTAKAIERFAILLNHEDDARDLEALTVAICNLAQRIGWAADMAMDRSARSTGPCYGDAVQWMMPPSFHDDAPAPKP